MKRLIYTVLLGLAVSTTAFSADIYNLITQGKLDEARRELSSVATASSRDGNVLFYLSLLEPDAAQSARLMEASLSASVSVRFQEEIYYRLAQYSLLTKDWSRLSELLIDYRSRWENGKYEAEMLRLSILFDESQQNYESALTQCDRFLVQNPSETDQQWGQVDKARIFGASGKGIGSLETLRKISRAKRGDCIPQALYVLGMNAARKQRTDDAVFFYNLLREGYPDAVGLDEIVDRLGSMSSSTSSDDAAEKLTGTYYSVKVGVFIEKANANRQADVFRRHGKKTEVQRKTISGKTYHVVYVGRFQDFAEASRFKTQLEAEHGEPFQVVTR